MLLARLGSVVVRCPTSTEPVKRSADSAECRPGFCWTRLRVGSSVGLRSPRAVRQVESSGAGSFQARDPGAADDDTGHMTPARVLAHRATTAHSLRCREAECHHAEILKDEDMDSCQEVDDGIKVHSLLYHTIHV